MSITLLLTDTVKHPRSSSAFVGNRCERLLGNEGGKKNNTCTSVLPNHPKEVETFIHSVAVFLFPGSCSKR